MRGSSFSPPPSEEEKLRLTSPVPEKVVSLLLSHGLSTSIEIKLGSRRSLFLDVTKEGSNC
jgi:hypothetical protein